MNFNKNTFVSELTGKILLSAGSLGKIDLSKHLLLADDDASPTKYDNWTKPSQQILKCYGDNPSVMILGVDNLEIYYKILLGEEVFWFPTKYTEQI